jgi:hypothetical protein
MKVDCKYNWDFIRQFIMRGLKKEESLPEIQACDIEQAIDELPAMSQ